MTSIRMEGNGELVEKNLYGRPGMLKNLTQDHIWLKFGHLITNQIDLSFGFPDFVSYPEISDAFKEALATDGYRLHQYTRPLGHPRLVKALAKYYENMVHREIDPLSEIIVTPGADYAVYLTMSALLDEGDEVIFFEPFYMFYNMVQKIRGAKIVYIPLKPKPDAHKKGYTTSADWVWDDAQLEAAFNPKTKLIVICTPSNPLGKVMSPEELEKIASLCIKHNVICVSDEVYHRMVYEDDQKHTSIASLPGMWERTITVGSAGKLLSTTGLKSGWIVGDKRLIHKCGYLFLISAIVCPTVTQEVIAIALEKELARYDSPDCYFNRIKAEAKAKRDYLANMLISFGMDIVVPEAGYFMIANISKLKNFDFKDDEPELPLNVQYLRYMIKKGVIFFPCSEFFSSQNVDFHGNYVRICFFKKNETLEKAVELLKSVKFE